MTRTRALLTWASLPLGALLLAGCGADPAQQKVEPAPDQVPTDLCATVPSSFRQGMEADSSSAGGNDSPSAACSLRSKVGTADPTRILVTWLQTDDGSASAGVLASQCAAFDKLVYKVDTGYRATGASDACAASGGGGGQGGATIAARTERQVLVVRYDGPGNAAKALASGTQVLEGVLAKLSPGS